jgi:hypothetical protein
MQRTTIAYLQIPHPISHLANKMAPIGNKMASNKSTGQNIVDRRITTLDVGQLRIRGGTAGYKLTAVDTLGTAQWVPDPYQSIDDDTAYIPGALGIGEINPQEALHVNGSIMLTGSILPESSSFGLGAGATVSANSIDLTGSTVLNTATGDFQIAALGTDTLVGTSYTQTLSNKTLAAPIVSGTMDMQSSGTVTGLTSPSADSDAATKEYVDDLVSGIDWQESVLTIEGSEPGGPSTGDRHIIGTDIGTYNGSTWDYVSPSKGTAVLVESEDTQYNFNGTSWVKFGTLVNHGNLLDLAQDHHTQYTLLAGRAGGQSLSGGTAAGNNMTIDSTSNASKGFVNLQPSGGNVGIRQTTPTHALHVGSGEIGLQNAQIASATGDSLELEANAANVSLRPTAGSANASLVVGTDGTVTQYNTSGNAANTFRTSGPSVFSGELIANGALTSKSGSATAQFEVNGSGDMFINSNTALSTLETNAINLSMNGTSSTISTTTAELTLQSGTGTVAVTGDLEITSGTLNNSTAAFTLPGATSDTLVGANTAQTLLNKTFQDTNFSIGSAADMNVDVDMDLSSATSGTTTLAFSHTGSRVISVPDATDTLVARNTTDTLTNKTLSGNELGTFTSGGGTYTMPSGGTDVMVGRDTVDTLTNKTLDSPIVTGNMTVGGNLTVNGTYTYMNTATVQIEDNMVLYADGNSGDAVDIGFIGAYVDGGTKYTGLFRDASDGRYRLYHSASTLPETTVGAHTAADLTVADLEADTISYPSTLTIGSNIMHVDAGDRVGFGTGAPATEMDIVGGTRTTGPVATAMTGTATPIASTTLTGTGTAFLTEIIPGDIITVGAQSRAVTAVASDTSLTVGVAFSPAGAAVPTVQRAPLIARDNTNTDRLIVTPSGAVGIGTNNPNTAYALNVAATDAEVLMGGPAGVGLVVNTGTVANTSGAFTVLNDGGTLLNVQNDGHVGIGTLAPGELLEVSGSAVGDGARIGNVKTGVWEGSTDYAAFTHNSVHGTANSYALMQHSAGDTYLNAASTKAIRFMNNHSQQAIIDANGNFGIGTTPTEALDVLGNALITGNVTITGGLTGPVTEYSISAAVTSAQEYITIDATSGNVTVTLPLANTALGKRYTFTRTDASGNTATVAAAGADTIGGGADIALAQDDVLIIAAVQAGDWIIL